MDRSPEGGASTERAAAHRIADFTRGRRASAAWEKDPMTIDFDFLEGLVPLITVHMTSVCAVAWLVARRVLVLRAAERAYRIRLARWTAESRAAGTQG